jgi:hypothetical protein
VKASNISVRQEDLRNSGSGSDCVVPEFFDSLREKYTLALYLKKRVN